MPATNLHKILLTFGFLSLFHAAYSAAQHRSYLRLNELEFSGLPVDIVIQGVISLFMVMYSVMHMGGDFKDVRASADLEQKTWETFRNIPSFYTFMHRGRAFSPNYIPPTNKSSLDETE